MQNNFILCDYFFVLLRFIRDKWPIAIARSTNENQFIWHRIRSAHTHTHTVTQWVRVKVSKQNTYDFSAKTGDRHATHSEERERESSGSLLREWRLCFECVRSWSDSQIHGTLWCVKHQRLTWHIAVMLMRHSVAVTSPCTYLHTHMFECQSIRRSLPARNFKFDSSVSTWMGKCTA